MLIPATISLIISTIFLNLSLLLPTGFLANSQGQPTRIGKVLGVTEVNVQGDILVEHGDGFNKAIVKVIEEAKTIPLPRFLQPPQLSQPMRQLPKNGERTGQAVITDYDLPAENGVILDCQEDNLYFAKRADRAWPIASITKLFTAYTFLDYNPGWETNYEMKSADKREGGKIYLFTGDKVKVKDLFYFSLVGSDNTATAALVSSTGLSEQEFMEKMNAKIKSLGLKNTRLADPVGLGDGNISTAREVAEFARIVLSDPDIKKASLAKKYEFTTAQGKKKSIASTNDLLGSFPDSGIEILGGKTGHVNSSGYCLVSRFKNKENKEIVTVVLGASSESSRFNLTKKLVDLYYSRQQ